jgi:predicted GIY-YIG superfamily endonuclease
MDQLLCSVSCAAVLSQKRLDQVAASCRGAKAVLRPLDGTRRFAKWETVHYRLAMSPTGAFVVKTVQAPVSGVAPTTSVMTTLYTLRLEKNRWYVGSTSQGLDKRVEEHRRAFTGASSGAAWTAMYQVISAVRQREVPEHRRLQEEDAEVARLAQLHGVDSVRGGSYIRPKLSANEKAALERAFRTAKAGRYLAPADAQAADVVVPATSDDLVALQRLVTDMRRRTSSRGVTREEAEALCAAIIDNNSAGKYLDANGLHVLTLSKRGLPDKFWTRKPLPPASHGAFTKVVTEA